MLLEECRPSNVCDLLDTFFSQSGWVLSLYALIALLQSLYSDFFININVLTYLKKKKGWHARHCTVDLCKVRTSYV